MKPAWVSDLSYFLSAAVLFAVWAAIGLVEAHRSVGFLMKQQNQPASGPRTSFHGETV